VPTYSFIVGINEKRIHQYDHDTETVTRAFCQENATWSPFFGTNFNSSTGLPLSFALGETDLTNPCSIAADADSIYVLDPYSCRVLRFYTNGDLHVTFGGKRGIGTGKISPDGTRRSIIAVANDKVFLTDNDDGSGGSGNGWIVQYDSIGTFEAEYSIASWITDLTAVATFDQVTGWAYDTARGCYWALAQGSANCYLLRIDLTGTPTGEVIDLTARLSIPGHSGSPAGRLLTRGLRYQNGYLYLWTGNQVIRVDLTNTAGDLVVATEGQIVGPGSLAGDGTTITYVLQGGSNGSEPIKVLTLATAASRTYGYEANPPDGEDGHIGGSWEIAVVPSTEDSSTRTSRDLSLRARINAITTRALQMRAAIRGTVTRTLQMRARILQGVQHQIQMRARIEEPTTIADAVVESWELEDSLGTYSKGLTLHASSLDGFALGDELTLHAGYDQTRVRLGRFVIDEIGKQIAPNEESYEIGCRDVGAKEIDSTLVTKTWQVQFPRTSVDLPSVKAYDVLREAAITAGVDLGNVEFPNYPLYGNFVVDQQSFVQIAQSLMEPWNLFPHEQYHIQAREGVVSILRRDWTTVPSNGYVISRAHVKSMTRKQTAYLQSPRLTSFTDFVVKGVSVTLSVLEEIGPQTKVEYFRREAEGDTQSLNSGSAGSTGTNRSWILMETTSIETTYNDKVLTRQEANYATVVNISTGSGATNLVSRNTDTHLYFEPAGPLGLDSIQTASVGPSPVALPYQVNSVNEGIADGTFQELFRGQTDYLYDQNNQLAVEYQSTQEFDTATNTWSLTSLTQRTHSQTTGGSVRVHRSSFGIEDSDITLGSVDRQQVGGSRPSPTNVAGRSNVFVFQAISPVPQIVVDAPGLPGSHVVDPGGTRFVWSYENGWLGQNECDDIRDNALEEQALQSGGWHWDEVSFVSVLNPNLYSGMALHIEIDEAVFEDYWLESVSNSFETQQATTRVTAKRLTTEILS
jgi:hypothetical protein